MGGQGCDNVCLTLLHSHRLICCVIKLQWQRDQAKKVSSGVNAFHKKAQQRQTLGLAQNKPGRERIMLNIVYYTQTQKEPPQCWFSSNSLCLLYCNKNCTKAKKEQSKKYLQRKWVSEEARLLNQIVALSVEDQYQRSTLTSTRQLAVQRHRSQTGHACYSINSKTTWFRQERQYKKLRLTLQWNEFMLSLPVSFSQGSVFKTESDAYVSSL